MWGGVVVGVLGIVVELLVVDGVLLLVVVSGPGPSDIYIELSLCPKFVKVLIIFVAVGYKFAMDNDNDF